VFFGNSARGRENESHEIREGRVIILKKGK